MACPTGIEPVTPSLEGWCSIRLSYGHHSNRISPRISMLVGVERFELPTSWSQTRRATRLRYTPEGAIIYLCIEHKVNLRYRPKTYPSIAWRAELLPECSLFPACDFPSQGTVCSPTLLRFYCVQSEHKPSGYGWIRNFPIPPHKHQFVGSRFKQGCHVAHHIFDKFRVIVCFFGNVLLIRAFQQSVKLARCLIFRHTVSAPRSR